MARRARNKRAAPAPQLTLKEAAERIGIAPGELAEIIREAGIAPKLPKGEWRLGFEEVSALMRERARVSERNERELAKLEGLLEDE